MKANINKWDRNKPIRNKTYKIFIPFSLRNTFIFFDLVSFQYHSWFRRWKKSSKKSMIERQYQNNIKIISLLFEIHSYVFHLFYVGVLCWKKYAMKIANWINVWENQSSMSTMHKWNYIINMLIFYLFPCYLRNFSIY